MASKTDDVAEVGGISDRLAFVVRRRARRKGAPHGLRRRVEAIRKLGEASLVREIEST